MKSSFTVFFAVLGVASLADSGAHFLYAAEAYEGRIQCGPLMRHEKQIDRGFAADVKAYNDRGSLRATRYMKSSPGHERFEATVDADGELSISGTGAFDDPSRHSWTYQFRGPVARNGDTTIEGGLLVPETGATRDCRFTLEAEGVAALATSAQAAGPSRRRVATSRFKLEPDVADNEDLAPAAEPQPDALARRRAAAPRVKIADSEDVAPATTPADAQPDAPPRRRPAAPRPKLESDVADNEDVAPAADRAKTPAAQPSAEDGAPPAAADPKPQRKNAATGFDALARLVALPPACEAVKHFGAQSSWPRGWAKETRDPFTNAYSQSDVCKKITECMPSLAGRFGPLADYLRTRPLLYAALKGEAKASSSMNLDAAVSTLVARVDLSVNDCSLDAVKLDSLMARSGADPGHSGVPAPFEYVQAATQDLSAKLRDERGARDSAYAEWQPYAKHYERATALGAAKQGYDLAFDGPDLEPLLQAAQSFDEEMSKAVAFQNRLAEQGKQLTALSLSLAELGQRTSEPPLVKLIRPETSAAVAALKSKVDGLAGASAPDRGDVSTDLSAFATGEAAIRSEIKTAQDRLDAMLRQGTALAALNDRVSDLASRAGQGAVVSLLKSGDSGAIKDLGGEVGRLAQAPVPERGDVANQLAKFEARFGELQSEVEAAEEKAAASAKLAQEKAQAAAATKAKADLRAKGLAYASESGTTWEVTRSKNEMTDRIDVTATSLQQPAPGVEAQVTASCPDHTGVVFEALITDDQGKPTVTFPGLNNEVGAIRVRDNDGDAALVLVNSNGVRRTYANKFALGVIPFGLSDEDLSALRGNRMLIDQDTMWRHMVEIGTNEGPAVIKIPLYAEAIQQVIAECRQ